MELAFIYAIEVFIFGVCIGSFLNVVVYRINNHGSPLRGRSFCPKCKHQLSWLDNIPLLSFILLKGKCRYCHSPISWQYPLVELCTAIVTLLVFFKISNISLSTQFSNYNEFSIFNFLISLIISYCLIIIFVSDFLYYTVPAEPIIIAIIAAIIVIIFFNGLDINFLYSALGAGLFFEFLHLITHKKGMGFGDVEIAFLTGFLLGWPGMLVSIMLAFLTGAVVGVILILAGRKKMSSRIAFGPFLVFYLWVVLIFPQFSTQVISLFLK